MSAVITVKYNHMPRMSRQLRAKASEGLRRTAATYEANLEARMHDGPKSGRMYGTHQASAPGEAPAVDTGALVNSIQTDAQPGSLTAAVATSMDYATHLEYGTVHMAPRPAWTPEAELAAETYFPENMQRAIAEALR